MARVNIYFTEDILRQLRQYILDKYGKHRILSVIVQQAVKEFLERELKK